jgi:hypothetical protein
MSNLDLWNRVSKTDPKHVKPITGKQYSGNSPKPYYIVQRLTEEFGPVGRGWGFDIVQERFERLSEHDVLHVATVRFWHGDKAQSFEQMGQTKACYMTSKGSLLVDEDAPKKSVTDALVKCASYLGFAGDIFSGRWDDSKYVAELRKEFESDSLVPVLEASIEQAKQKKAGVMNAVLQDIHLDDMTKASLSKLAKRITPLPPAEAYQILEDNGLDSDEKTWLWSLLDSKVRSALKHEKDTRALMQHKETA